MSSEQLGSGVNILKGDLAASFDILSGSAASYQDLGIARRFGGAAAAYSLRDVGAMNGPVVEVRRSSDTQTQDFSAAQVSSGALETFTRAVAPNFSGNALNFDGSSTYVQITQLTLSGDFTFSFDAFVDFNNDGGGRVAGRTTAAGWVASINSPTALSVRANGSSGKGIAFNSAISSGEHSFILTRSSNVISLSIDGVTQTDTVNEENNFTVNFIGRQAANYFKGSIRNINFGSASYNGYGNTDADWEDQTGSNDGTVNGTADTFFGSDGFVTTWYDQSGNGNNATQGTVADQPKIVSNGSVITETQGKPAIQFATSAEFLTFSTTNLQSMFSVVSNGDVAADEQVLIANDGVNNKYIRLLSGGTDYNPIVRLGATMLTFADLTSGEQDVGIIFVYNRTDANNNTIHINNSAKAIISGTDTDLNADIDVDRIGTRNSSLDPWAGKMQEIIIFDKDMSGDRTDLQNDMANFYSITLS